MCIHPPCGFPADPRRGFQIGQPRHLHPARRTEMVQQSALAGGANAGDLVDLALPDGLRTPGAVGRDGEAVRLVAQSLEEIQNRVAWRQLERFGAVGVEPLAAGW